MTPVGIGEDKKKHAPAANSLFGVQESDIDDEEQVDF